MEADNDNRIWTPGLIFFVAWAIYFVLVVLLFGR